MWIRRYAIIFGAAVVLLAAFWGILIYRNYHTVPVFPEQATDFTLDDFSGKAVTLSAFRGRPVIINFWEASCIFCKYEMPVLNEAASKYSHEGLVVLGIHRSTQENLVAGRRFAEELHITYPLLSEGKNSDIYDAYAKGIRIVPVTVFINRDGSIQSTFYGSRAIPVFRKMIEDFINQSKQ